ncbi:PKD domain-containing protein, partial [Methanogenium sp. MK-MG]|uniref:PKD domain-containing protein n=1 Tax=Methanogenium sp. MK-MG TaxID=2599926 RepID=UPI0013ECE79F
MRKQLLILLVVLALLAVPVAAEEKNWNYTIKTTLDPVSAGLNFGCNLVTTDYVDNRIYDMVGPPANPDGTTYYANLKIYESEGVFNSTRFIQALNAPLTPGNDVTVFNLAMRPDDDAPTVPFTITWDPVADADYLSTITSITLVNLSDTSDTHDMMVAGSATGTGYYEVPNYGPVPLIRSYSITVTYDLPVPVAAFSGAPTTIDRGDAVTFTDASTPVGLIDSWAWDFGDGGTSADQSPVYTYTTSGTHTVTLTATNEAGNDAEVKTNYITVRTDPPVANFTFDPAAPLAGNPVTFTDASTGIVDTYFWDFGDGATATISVPVHAYAVAGTYTVNLTATNSGGSDSFQDTVTVSVQDAPVVLFSAAPRFLEANNTVDFVDLSSGYNITAWAWDFGDTIGTSTEQSPSYVYLLSGIYNVSLTVTNAGGSDTMTMNDYITVTGPAPAASFTANVTTGDKPLTVTFTDTSQAFAGANIVTWAWDFGDGGTSALQNPTYTYSDSGSYNVFLTVTDDATTPASDTSAPTNIMVSGPAPVADFNGTPTLVSV